MALRGTPPGPAGGGGVAGVCGTVALGGEGAGCDGISGAEIRKGGLNNCFWKEQKPCKKQLLLHFKT